MLSLWMFTSLGLWCAAADAMALTVTVMRVPKQKANMAAKAQAIPKVYCRLFAADKAKSFPMQGKDAQVSLEVVPQEDKAVCVFPNIRNGDYAVSVYYDTNGNGTFDRTFFGYPKEPWGVSRSKGRFKTPSFKDAMFTVTDKNRSIVVELR